jgi:hypothetical protein
MKKLILISILAIFSLTTFSQVVKTGKGLASSPYLLTWVVRNVDTIIQLPPSPIGTNYVMNVTVHYWLNNYTTGKIIPVQSPTGVDSLNQYMAFDTTKCTLVQQAYNRRTICFDSQFTSANIISLQYKKGASVTGGKLWIYIVFKTTL